MNRPPANRCAYCDRPVTIPGNNWRFLKEIQEGCPAHRVTHVSGAIVGYVHARCPAQDDGADAEV